MKTKLLIVFALLTPLLVFGLNTTNYELTSPFSVIIQPDAGVYVTPGDGTINLNGKVTVASTTDASHPCPTMTTAERGSGTPGAGDCIYNSTDGQLQQYVNGAWGLLGGGGDVNNLLTDGGYDGGVNVGSNGLDSCSTATCSRTIAAANVALGDGALDINATGAGAVDKCYDNTGAAWDNTMVEVRAKVKTSLAGVQICYSDTATASNCVNVTNDGAYNNYKIIQQVTSEDKVCYRITYPGAGNVYVDGSSISDLKVDGTTKVEVATLHHEGSGGGFQDRIGPLQFPSDLDDSDIVGDTGLFSIDNDQDPTYFEALVDLDNVQVHFDAEVTVASARFIALTDTSRVLKYYMYGGTASGTGYRASVNGNFSLKAGEGFYIGSTINNDSNLARLFVTATRYVQATVLSDTSDFLIDANIYGATNANLSTVSQSQDVDINATNLTLEQNSISSPVSIACDASEVGTSTVCTGPESIGIVFTYSGRVRACASFSHHINMDAAGLANVGFQINVTENDSDVNILQHGGEKVISNEDGTSLVAIAATAPIKVCGVFDVTGLTTLRLMYEQSISPTLNANSIAMDRNATLNDNDVHFSVIPITKDIVGTFKPAVASSVRKSSPATTLASGTTYYMDYDSLDTDPDSNFTGCGTGNKTDTGSGCGYVVPEDGDYLLSASFQLAFTNMAADKGYSINIAANNTNLCGQSYEVGTAHTVVTEQQAQVTCVKPLLEGDVIEVKVTQNFGTASNSGDNNNHWFAVTRIDQAGRLTQAEPTLYSRKFLTSDVSADDSNVPDLSHSNLTIGKYYRVTIHALCNLPANQLCDVTATNNSVNVLFIRLHHDQGGGVEPSSDASAIFKAAATTMLIGFDEGTNAILRGDGSIAETWVQLEELPNHQETTKF